jgi:hypothetical protein
MHLSRHVRAALDLQNGSRQVDLHSDNHVVELISQRHPTDTGTGHPHAIFWRG